VTVVVSGGICTEILALLPGALLSAAPQTLSSFLVALLCIYALWRFGWLDAAGITRPGNWQVWLLTTFALLYLSGVYLFLRFGYVQFSSPELAVALPISLRVFFGGLLEEIVFRGIILYALLRKWGGSLRGIVASVFVSALVFGLLHFGNAISPFTPFSFAAWQVLHAFLLAVWLGTLVLRWHSIWPAVAVHSCLNVVSVVTTWSSRGSETAVSAYVFPILMQLPLVIFGVFLLLQSKPRPVVPDTP
jgi:membrane protease YdiL (CAAX protease family)